MAADPCWLCREPSHEPDPCAAPAAETPPPREHPHWPPDVEERIAKLIARFGREEVRKAHEERAKETDRCCALERELDEAREKLYRDALRDLAAAREGQEALRAQAVRIRRAALGDEERPGVDTEEIVRESRAALAALRAELQAYKDRVKAMEKERSHGTGG